MIVEITHKFMSVKHMDYKNFIYLTDVIAEKFCTCTKF